jgi:hypothetical protein
MTEPKQELFEALSTDSAILSLLDGDTTRITEHYPDLDMLSSQGNNFTRLSYLNTERRHVFFTANTPLMDAIAFEIDIWIPHSVIYKLTLTEIALEIDRVMIGIGYRKLSSSDVNRPSEKVYNQVLTYEKEVRSNI